MFKVFSQNTGLLQDNIINLTENIISTISYQISPNIKIFNPDIVFKKKNQTHFLYRTCTIQSVCVYVECVQGYAHIYV